MAQTGDVHPWVAQRRNRITFGLQTFSRPDDPQPTRRVIEAGRLADRLGLDAFYLGDHPARAAECWMHLAVIAATTERVWLGSVVNCLGYRYPMLIARQATDLDHMAGGRTILGLGIGWDAPEFAELGLPYPSIRARQEALNEAVAIIEGVWCDAPFSFEGRHYSVRDALIAPAPVQRPRPPLLIAGAGEQVTLRQVARYGDACSFGASPQIGGVRTVDDVRHKLDVLRRHCEETGRPYDDILRTHFTAWLMIAPTEAEAQAKLRRYYPDGLTEAQRYSRVIGTPEQVAAYYQSLVQAGIQHFVCQSLDAEDVETFHLLAEDVAPRLGG
ncbi:MAG TPA: LLM class flavin-dependent oxidoreductase [Thermomicrobiales bacterium]|nr:LLM class flavin-dependent oxidoreductase [Thermomicrobiales bacterium]